MEIESDWNVCLAMNKTSLQSRVHAKWNGSGELTDKAEGFVYMNKSHK